MSKIDSLYIRGTNSINSNVILSDKELDFVIEELENNEDVELYDEGKKEDTGERILFAEYLEMRKNNKA